MRYKILMTSGGYMYDFKNLSPLDFEALIADLFSEEMAIPFELFTPGRDGGTDLRAYIGKIEKIVVQCKHYAGSSFSALLSKLKNNEVEKLRKINLKEYYLVTSLGLTPNNKEQLHELMKEYVVSPQNIYGKDDINALLKKHPNVERRHVKLWLSSSAVLDSILHSNIINLSRIEIKNIRDKIQVYVHNESYTVASKILNEHGYLVVSGIPGIGKSTLAEILLYEYLEKKFEVIKISENISEALKIFKQDKSQIFYYDDFLGQTNLADKLSKNEDHALITFIKEIKKSKNKKFILTTREYILKQAKQTYELLNDQLLNIGKCVIDLSHYSKIARAKILYNHLYFSKLPNLFLKELFENDTHIKIVNHENYNPRIIEWMVNVYNLMGVDLAPKKRTLN